MKDCQEIAIYIVQSTKATVETVKNDIKNEKTLEELFPNFDYRLEKIEKKDFRNFNLDLFDNTQKYYEDLFQYFSFHLSRFFSRKKIFLIKFQSSFAIIYFSFLTDLLLHILNNNKQAYLDDIIKFDITALTEILIGKSKKLIYSDTFFLNCENELIEKNMKGNDDYILKKMILL